MNKFRKLLIRFKTLKDLKKFYKIEFKNLTKLNNYNIRINYRKANINNLSLYGYDSKMKFKSKFFTQNTLDNMFKLIDKMPMRTQDKNLALPLDRYSICGLVNNYRTSHCFNDSTHQTCCLLGSKARQYSNESGNPIGEISEEIFYKYFGKKPTSNDLTPWCTCIGSKVCSYYANKFKDGTHIKFINDLNDDFLIYGLDSKCENKISSKLNFQSHLTPGVNNTINKNEDDCEFYKYTL